MHGAVLSSVALLFDIAERLDDPNAYNASQDVERLVSRGKPRTSQDGAWYRTNYGA